MVRLLRANRVGRGDARAEAWGFLEVEGAADVALEIVSPTWVRKDTMVLKELHFLAGVREYWLVDARISRRRGTESPPAARFDLFQRTSEGYMRANASDEWQRSEALDASFRLVSGSDRLGHPQFTLETR